MGIDLADHHPRPASLAAWAKRIPTGPPPRTTTRSPSSKVACRSPWIATAKGSVRTACSKDSPSGSLTIRSRGATTYSANPHPPARQGGEAPGRHDTLPGMAGAAAAAGEEGLNCHPIPAFSSGESASTISPTNSCPGTTGGLTRGLRPEQMYRSEPQMPAYLTLINPWPGPACGQGRSWRESPGSPVKTAAFYRTRPLEFEQDFGYLLGRLIEGAHGFFHLLEGILPADQRPGIDAAAFQEANHSRELVASSSGSRGNRRPS